MTKYDQQFIETNRANFVGRGVIEAVLAVRRVVMVDKLMLAVLLCRLLCGMVTGVAFGALADVDVVIAGGTGKAVAAAERCRREGRSVCVLTPRNYLGENDKITQ